MSSRDSIYAEPREVIEHFSFDEKVAAVFPDMIKRSVPGYSTVIAMTGVLAGQYAQDHTNCYDLGCSLGESSFAMCSQLHHRDCSIIAVDNSPQMLEQCALNLQKAECSVNVELVCDDILNVQLDNSSVVVLNYTLQFIEASQRGNLVQRIYDSLRPGGILLLSEKIRFEDAITDQRMIDMHHQFKKANGYSDLEISQKRTALENVLLPETLQTHQQRLQQAGFAKTETWFQCFNFASLIAYKSI